MSAATKHSPVRILAADCHRCTPWVRWVRTDAGAFVRQERHEDGCHAYPAAS